MICTFVNLYLEHLTINLPGEKEKTDCGLFFGVVDLVHQRAHRDVVGKMVITEASCAEVHPGPFELSHNVSLWQGCASPLIQRRNVIFYESLKALQTLLVNFAIVFYFLVYVVVGVLDFIYQIYFWPRFYFCIVLQSKKGFIFLGQTVKIWLPKRFLTLKFLKNEEKRDLEIFSICIFKFWGDIVVWFHGVVDIKKFWSKIENLFKSSLAKLLRCDVMRADY